MRHLSLALIAGVSLITANAAFAGDGDEVKRDVVTEYDFSGFDKVDISGVYTVEIRQGDRFSVRTEATKDKARWSEVKMKGDTLVLGKKDRKKGWWKDDDYEDQGGVHAFVTMPRLTELDVSGVTNGTVSAFSGGSIEVDASGVANLTLSGSCDHLEIDASGVSNIDAEALLCASVEVDASGVSNLEVYASNRIEADSSGMSEIGVHGNPADREIEDSRMAKVVMR